MFIGHIAVALGAKKASPKTSLGTLLLAAQWPDLIWPLFLALGWEKVEIAPGITAVSPLDFTHYPLSHSLLADCGWASWRSSAEKPPRGLLDRGLRHEPLASGRAQPSARSSALSPGRSPGGIGAVEFRFWHPAGGRNPVRGRGTFTQSRDKTGDYAFRSFVGLLVFLYLVGLMGPPPPSVGAVEVVGFLGWLMVPWAYWIDRHRAPRPAYPASLP